MLEARKDNKVYTIDEGLKKRYLDEGYDIYQDGNLIQYSSKKMMKYQEHVDIVKQKDSEIKQLQGDKKTLEKANKTLTEENQALKTENEQLKSQLEGAGTDSSKSNKSK